MRCYFLIWPILEARAKICQKKFQFLGDLKTPKNHSEINWPLDGPIPKWDEYLKDKVSKIFKHAAVFRFKMNPIFGENSLASDSLAMKNYIEYLFFFL